MATSLAILEALKRTLKRQLATDVRRVEAFKAFVERDARQALKESQEVFRAAARSEAFATVIAYADRGISGEVPADDAVQHIQAFCFDRMKTGAKFPQFSTSPCSNMIEAYDTAAYAEAGEELESAIKFTK